MRKRKWSRFLAVLFFLGYLFSVTTPVMAGNTSAYTYVISSGEWKRSQDAYIPNQVLMQNTGLKQPEDIFISGENLYVADTGNCRIVKMNLTNQTVQYIGGEILSTPTGVFVSEDGTIYVADSGNLAIICFDAKGNEIKRYQRPTEAAFGTETQYLPSKVAVSNEGILYVVSSGSYDGMIQMDSNGEFLGYFGYNNNPTSLWDWIVDRFFTEEQKAQLLNKVPFSFRNMTMDSKELLYTVTMTAEGDAVKKHDASGINLFSSDMHDEKNFVDLCIGPEGQVYAVTETGLIYEYDVNGNLLFSLGGLAASKEMMGLFTKVAAMECDENGALYVLDQERGIIHTFEATEYADNVHSAMALYNSGRYEESEAIWKSVKTISGSCEMVDNGLADCAFQRRDYETAAKYYKLADNREGYSDSYWQIRNDQLAEILPAVIVVILLLAASVFVRKHFLKKQKKINKPSQFKDNMALLFAAIRHPVDTFYSIRFEGKGDYMSSTVIYVIAFLVFACNYVMRGFVISYSNTENTSILLVVLFYAAPVVLFIFCNFLVGAINDSIARFRDVYVGAAYITAPFIVFMPFLILFSHIATLNEGRILSLASFAIYAWVVIMLIIFVKEVHMYLLRDVFKNLVITVFLMAVVVVTLSFLGMFFDQMIGFFVEVIKEVQLRVG